MVTALDIDNKNRQCHMIKDLPLDAYIVMAKVIKFCFMNDYVQFFKVFRNAITLT